MSKSNLTECITLVWFRNDLRLHDNPALSYAAAQGPVLPIYIYDTQNPGEYQSGEASRWWLNESLSALDSALNGRLNFFLGDPLEVLRTIVSKMSVQTIVWNRCYEPWQIARDINIKQAFENVDIETKSFNGGLLWEPWEVLKSDHTPYRVFTPYFRNGCLNNNSPRIPIPQAKNLTLAEPKAIGNLKLSKLNLKPSVKWYKKLVPLWAPGEAGAKTALSIFLKNALKKYNANRNIPATLGTSRLSPHLHFGEISPNQVWYAALNSMSTHTEDGNLNSFLSELGWREFSYYLLYHFPALPRENFNKKYNAFAWQQNAKALLSWQRGETGIPIVDAGMRELWQTGYMHNRVRMIVASFLVKNLLLHWRHGERWFWDCLIDADLAANCASWQWVAGTGTDAAPYYRIFNPVTQGEKFDPEGEYVLRYCPELRHLPKKYRHQPWTASSDILATANIILGKHYPKPIVDLKVSRQRALDAFAQLKLLANF